MHTVDQPRSKSVIAPLLVALAASVLFANATRAQTGTLQEIGGILTQQQSPTVIYTAREFITMDPKKPRAEAVAVKDGKFVAVGTRAEVGAAAGKDARLDKTFTDKVVIAGFVEQHVHPVLAALTMSTRVISIEDWDAIDGFSPAVRDQKGYEERLQATALAAHRTRSQAVRHLGLPPLLPRRHMSRELLERAGAGLPGDRLAPLVPRVLPERRGAEEGRHRQGVRRRLAQERAGAGEPARRGTSSNRARWPILARSRRDRHARASFRKGLEYTETYYHRNGITLACEPGGFPRSRSRTRSTPFTATTRRRSTTASWPTARASPRANPNDPAGDARGERKGARLGQGPHLATCPSR